MKHIHIEDSVINYDNRNIITSKRAAHAVQLCWNICKKVGLGEEYLELLFDTDTKRGHIAVDQNIAKATFFTIVRGNKKIDQKKEQHNNFYHVCAKKCNIEDIYLSALSEKEGVDKINEKTKRNLLFSLIKIKYL